MSEHDFETSLFRCPSPTASQLVQIVRMEEEALVGTSTDSDPLFIPETPPQLQGRTTSDEVSGNFVFSLLSFKPHLIIRDNI